MQPARRRSVVDVALQGDADGGRCRSRTRPRRSSGCGSATACFHQLTRAAAIVVLVILGGVIVSLVIGSLPALQRLRLRLPDHRALEPGHREVRRARADLRHPRHLVHRDADRGAGRAHDRGVPHRAVPDVAAPPDRHRDRAARRHSEHHLRHLGPVRLRAVPAADAAAVPDRRRSADSAACLVDPLFAGPPYGIGVLTAGLILAIMVLPFITSISRDVFDAVPPVLKEAAYGLGCTTWEVVRYVVLPYTRVGVIGGVMLGLGRALGETMAVTFVIGNAHRISGLDPGARHHDLGHHRQRIHRGGRRPLHLVADRARPDPVRHHLHRAGGRALHAAAHRAADRVTPWHSARSTRARRRRNGIAMALSLAATLFGLGWLVLILGVLLWEGFSGLSLAVFTEMTPPPGSDGGLLNPIVGSLVMTVLAVLIGTPIGMLAGTYMAEYGRYDQLTHGRALHQRHPAQRAVDRHRPVHLRGHGRADGAFLRTGRRGRARRDRHAGGGAHHRGHADAGARTSCARPRPRSACRAPS